MKTPVVTFDCDGVFANYTRRFTEPVNQQFGTQITEHWPSYYQVATTLFTPEEDPDDLVLAWHAGDRLHQVACAHRSRRVTDNRRDKAGIDAAPPQHTFQREYNCQVTFHVEYN